MRTEPHTLEQIVNKLREIELLMASGKTVTESERIVGISDRDFYLWRQQYGELVAKVAHRTPASRPR